MINDDQILTLRVLGHMYIRLGLKDKADRLIRALLTIKPNEPGLLGASAALALDHDKPQEALEKLTRLFANSLTPDPTFILIKAQALWRLGRVAEALEAKDQYLATLGAVRVDQ
ncbi:MAG: hypothetical protein LBT86_06100 [Deltaproteobacteria bacterium]|jgi:predicted Zn-dependent protease|nr:hypothetical protein [Deltaproteobacteria bacterium]